MLDNENFHKHYTGLFKAKLQQYEQFQEGNSESRAPPTFFEVRRQLRALKTGKAPGQSGITIETFKLLEEEIATVLTLMFRNLWENTELVPQKCKDAKVISLYKKGDQMDPGNYRSLFMLETEGKLLCKILKERIDDMTVMKLDSYQFGFKKC